jgi:beta-lactamase class A
LSYLSIADPKILLYNIPYYEQLRCMTLYKKTFSLILVLFLTLTSNAFAASFLDSMFRPSPATQAIVKDSKAFDGTVGIYAKNLKTKQTFSYNADLVFPTASTSKLVVALAVYKYLYPTAGPDKQSQYDNDIRYMMTVSDNDSFYELLDEINNSKFDALNKVVRDLKLKKTLIHSDAAFAKYQYHSVTTPNEMGTVFENLYWDRYVGAPKSELMKDELANSIFHDEIPRYMLTKVMHKVGELDDILCDVGIVDDGQNQILISVYTKTNNSTDYASDFIANTSAKLYNALRKK